MDKRSPQKYGSPLSQALFASFSHSFLMIYLVTRLLTLHSLIIYLFSNWPITVYHAIPSSWSHPCCLSGHISSCLCLSPSPTYSALKWLYSKLMMKQELQQLYSLNRGLRFSVGTQRRGRIYFMMSSKK